MEASDVFEVEQRYSAASYNEFVSQIRRGYNYSLREAEYDRQDTKTKIREFKIKIKALRDKIKKPLPKRPSISTDAYLEYVENSKENAIKENREWIDPEDYLALKEGKKLGMN